MFTTAKSHDVSEILDPNFTPGPSQEEKELFEAKQTFMYKVFKESLQTNMGRYKVRMCLRTTDAQAVWKEFSEYMATAPKVASEKRLKANEKADGKSDKNSATFLALGMEKWRKSPPVTNLWTICFIWILPAFHLN